MAAFLQALVAERDGPLATRGEPVGERGGPVSPRNPGPDVHATLRALVWDPLVSHLEGVETIFLSPDGVLGTLPFGVRECNINSIFTVFLANLINVRIQDGILTFQDISIEELVVHSA